MSAPTERYTSVAITLHWVIAFAIIGMIFGGWYMTDLPDGAPGLFSLYQLKLSVVIPFFLFIFALFLWGVFTPPPPLPDEMNGLEKTA
ncbi:MAG: cytochrome b/b6 domain-containing protein, partial [Pseudomonadota bacterium]